MHIELDINTQIYPIDSDKVCLNNYPSWTKIDLYDSTSEKYEGRWYQRYFFSKNLSKKGLYNQDSGTVEKQAIDSYDYVMYGKIFECKSRDKEKMYLLQIFTTIIF